VITRIDDHMLSDAGAGRGPTSARTYRGADNGGLGGFVGIFPGGLAICGIAFLLAPLRWHTSIAIAVPVALIFFGAAYWLWRLSARLRRASLTVSAAGVTIVNAGRPRDLSWDEILRFAPARRLPPARSGARFRS
jgi:hypothetical protein